MAISWEQLRKAVLEVWQVATPQDWLNWETAYHSDPVRLLADLQSKPRIETTQHTVPFITDSMKECLENGTPQNAVVSVGFVSWLLLDKLGQGGMGEVWLVCEMVPTPDALYALKRVRPDLIGKKHDNTLRLAQREIQVLRQVRKVRELVELIHTEDATGTLILKLVSGQNLAEKTKSWVRWPLYSVLRVGVDICKALLPLHEQEFIHRDVKPANIIDSENGHAVLIDLGLAEKPDIASREPGGTFYFIAPEVYRGETVDGRADIYSLAATMYYLLTGQTPHFQQCLDLKKMTGRRTILDIERFQFERTAVDCDIRDIRTDLPVVFQRLLSECLSPEPDIRPTNVTSLMDRLKGIRNQLDKAVVLEQALRKFASENLSVYRDVHQEEGQYKALPWAQANAILRDFRDLLPNTSPLSILLHRVDDWAGFSSIHAIVPGTVKMVMRFQATLNQLENALKRHPKSTDADEIALIDDLNTRTLETIRELTVHAYREAHEWRTVLLALGAL
ncbi:MAG: serine/threonine protein kinase [Fimbriiglobus sp.]